MHSQVLPFIFLSSFLAASALNSKGVRQQNILKADSLDEPLAPTNDPLYKRFAALVTPYGYPLEQHFVTTSDGYILRLFRIPDNSISQQDANRLRTAAAAAAPGNTKPSHTKYNTTTSTKDTAPRSRKPTAAEGQQPQTASPETTSRPVVYLQHGLLDSAATWVINGPDVALAFLLADEGYDVWMGNVRGNTFSRNHTTLSSTAPAFWTFSWDQFALLDLPAMLSHIIGVSGAPSLLYVGHSQGTTIALAALGQAPEVRAVVRAAALLAPVAMVQHISSIPLLAMAMWQTDSWFSRVGWREFLPSWGITRQLEGEMCVLQPALCLNFLTAICGYNPSNINSTRLPLYLSFTPAGTSVQNMAHWSQMIRGTRPWELRAYDYGNDCTSRHLQLPQPCNQHIYGSPDAPLYNLSAITTPLAIYGGGNDRLADPVDLEYLVEALAPGVVKELRMLPDYEHLDFIWGENARGLVYQHVLRFLQQY